MTCPHGSTFPRLAINARRDLIIKRGKGQKSAVYTNDEARLRGVGTRNRPRAGRRINAYEEVPTMRLAHVKDMRLYNNAGINLPVCMAGARILNTGFRGQMLNYKDAKQSPRACPKCIKGYAKRYSWAVCAA